MEPNTIKAQIKDLVGKYYELYPGEKREQIRMVYIKSYVKEDSEVKVIDFIDKMDIKLLRLKIYNNETTGILILDLKLC